MDSEPRQVRSNYLRGHLADVISEIDRHGAHVAVLRYNTPVAVIVPAEWWERAARALGGQAGE